MEYEFTFHDSFLGIQVGSDEVEAEELTGKSSDKQGNVARRGILVTNLFPRPDGEHSAAQLSGIISAGDRITAVNGQSVRGLPFEEAKRVLEGMTTRPCVISFQSSASSPNRKIGREKFKSRFRSRRKTSILREINSLSEILQSEKSKSFNDARGRLTSLETQITAIKKTIQIVKEDTASSEDESLKMKESAAMALEQLGKQIKPLQSQKKLLVKEIHSQRRALQERKRGADLYRHAIVGIEADISKSRAVKVSNKGREGDRQRALQTSLLNIMQRRDELKEIAQLSHQIFKEHAAAMQYIDALETSFSSFRSDGTPTSDNRRSSTSSNQSDSSPSRFSRLFSRRRKSAENDKNRPFKDNEVETIIETICNKLQGCPDLARYIDRARGIVNSAKSTIFPAHRILSAMKQRNEVPEDFDVAVTLLNYSVQLLEENANLFLHFCDQKMAGVRVKEFIQLTSGRLENLAEGPYSSRLNMVSKASIKKNFKHLSSSARDFF